MKSLQRTTSRKTSSSVARRYWIVSALLAGLLLFGLFAILRRGREEANWPLATGVIQDSRILLDNYMVAPKVAPRSVWKAEFQITYSARGRAYTSWFYSGIRGDELVVALRAKQVMRRPELQCFVKHNPAKPEVSVADCH